MLYNSINHGVICTNHIVEYTGHAVVCASHVDLLEIDQVASMFVYGKKNVYCWVIPLSLTLLCYTCDSSFSFHNYVINRMLYLFSCIYVL